MDRVRILIADDHAEFLAIAEQLIDCELDLEVVKTYDNGQAMIDESFVLHPDLFLIDISMPGLSGIETAQELRRIDHNAKIVFLTVHNDPDYLRSALATGALGYVIKRRSASDLVPALREALAGRRFVSDTPALAGAVE